MVPSDARVGTLVMLKVPESACVASWSSSSSSSSSSSGGAPTKGGARDEVFVQVPRGLRSGDVIQMFVRGTPVEFTVPEGAGGGATVLMQMPDAGSEST